MPAPTGLEGNLDVLAETDEITLPLGEPIAFQASCVDTANGAAELTLELNGSTVLTFTDETPLGNGVPGIQAWTFPVHEPIEVHWHEFAIRRPDS